MGEIKQDKLSPAKLIVMAKYDHEYRAVIADYNAFLSSSVASFNQAMASDRMTDVVPGTTLKP